MIDCTGVLYSLHYLCSLLRASADDLVTAETPAGFLFSAPVTRYGGGNFALKNLKEMKVTSSFLGLEEDIRKCGGRQTKVECINDYLMKESVGTCNCFPLNIKDFSQPGNNVSNILQFEKYCLS